MSAFPVKLEEAKLSSMRKRPGEGRGGIEKREKDRAREWKTHIELRRKGKRFQ